jgi:hypothetical protein
VTAEINQRGYRAQPAAGAGQGSCALARERDTKNGILIEFMKILGDITLLKSILLKRLTTYVAEEIPTHPEDTVQPYDGGGRPKTKPQRV